MATSEGNSLPSICFSPMNHHWMKASGSGSGWESSLVSTWTGRIRTDLERNPQGTCFLLGNSKRLTMMAVNKLGNNDQTQQQLFWVSTGWWSIALQLPRGRSGLRQVLLMTTGGPGINATRNKQTRGEQSTIYKQRTYQLQVLHGVSVPQTTEESGRTVTKEAWV